ncbi:MAG: hypothetical protein OXS29_07310 [bacterium]|nr:hypothetical protein [bacterium]MDE0289939.1 hypothetical protein [bacterium]MDE0437908.1 hypothetical protein [bacterium]
MIADSPAPDARAAALRVVILILMVAVSASCGGDRHDGLPHDALVLMVSSDLAVGPQRVLVAAVDRDNRSLVSDTPVGVVFYGPDGTAREETAARFMWAIPEVRGLWRANVTFDAPGNWKLAVRGADGRLVEGAPFSVAAEPQTVGVGERAPASLSKTSSDAPIRTITSDPEPDPRLYRMTVAEAVGSGRPAVVVFATPAFCTSRTCGPALDTAKGLVDDYPSVNWVHVEVYENLDAQAAEELVIAEPVVEWGLPNEPWVFVVDESGVVADRFEGVVDRMELDDALARVTS